MINGIYRLFVGSSWGDAVADSVTTDPPVLLVATFNEAIALGPFASHTDADIQTFINDLMNRYPSSKFLLVTYRDETTFSTQTTPATVGTSLQLPAVFCHVILSRFQRHRVCVSESSKFNLSWIRELQLMPQSIHSPQDLVGHMILHMGLRVMLEDLCRLIAECRWLGNTHLVVALLQCLAKQTVARGGLLAPKPNPGVPSTLLVHTKSRVQESTGVTPIFSLQEVGLRVETAVSSSGLRTESSHSMSSSPPPSLGVGMPEHQQEKPLLFIAVLHVCDKGYTRHSFEEVDWLLKQLVPNDTVFVSLAGDIVVYPCLASEARQRWRQRRETAREKEKKCPFSLRVSIQRMWEQAKCVLAFWRHQRLRRVAHGGYGPDSRLAVLFFTPSDSRIVNEVSMSCVQHQAPFFHVPVFCLVTPKEVGMAYKLMELCVLTQGRLLHTPSENVDFNCGTPTRAACDALFRTTLGIIRNTSHLDVAVFILADHRNGNSLGPLNTSETFGKVSTSLFRSESPNECNTGIYLELGSLSSGAEVPVYVSRRTSGNVDLTSIGIRILVFAYSIDRGEYEVLPLILLDAFTKVTTRAPPLLECAWWMDLKFAKKLVEDLQSETFEERDLISKLPSDEAGVALCHETYGKHATECPREVFLRRLARNNRLQLGLVAWLLSRYGAQAVGSLNGFEISSLSTLYQCWRTPSQSKENMKSHAMSQWVPPTTRSSACCFVDLRWINLSLCNAPVSTVEALLSLTFPFTSQPVCPSSRTLSLESFHFTSTVIRLASVKHVPVLEEAKARFIALLSVDPHSNTMTLNQIVPATTPEGIVGGFVHEFRNLQLKQMYCVVHFALRRSPNLWVVQEDILVADGISFATPWESVESVMVTSVTHNTVEMVWKGTSASVKVVCSPLESYSVCGKKVSRLTHRKQRTKTRTVVVPSPVAATGTGSDSTSGSPLALECKGSPKCALTDLHPCTIYHLCVTPFVSDPDEMHAMEKKQVESAELYFATCIKPKEGGSLRVDSVIPRVGDFEVTLSYPEFSSFAAISPTKYMKLRGTPRISIDGFIPERGTVRMQRDNISGKRQAVSTFILPRSSRVPVRIAFDVEVFPAFGYIGRKGGGDDGGSSSSRSGSNRSSSSSSSSSVGGNNNNNNNSGNSNVEFDSEMSRSQRGGKNRWIMLGVMPHTEEIGPFEVVSDLSCVLVRPTAVRLTWKGVSSTYTVSLMTHTATEGSICIRELLVPGSDPLELSLDDVMPCTKYEAVVKSASGVGVSNVEFCIPPQPPSPNALTVKSNMVSLFLSAQLPASECKERFISVTMMPLHAKVDNANGTPARVVASYSHVSEGQPLVVGIVEHWVVSEGHCVSSATTNLYAVTDLRCRTESDGSVMLAWTCAARCCGAPLIVHVGSESHSISAKNELRITLRDSFTPIRVRFTGPTIIEEVSPIFLLSAPPALSVSTCSLVSFSNGVVQIHVSEEFCASLRSLFAHLWDALNVLLCCSVGVEVELMPRCGKEGMLLSIPVEDSEIKVITLRVKLQEKNYDLLMGGETEEMALRNHPALLIPWSFSKPFDLSISSSLCIKGLHVKMLRPTSAMLSWFPLPVVSDHSECGVQVVIRCAAEELSISECREYVVPSNNSVIIERLLPATPYVVSVCMRDGSEGESVRFVTPHELKPAMIHSLLASLSMMCVHEEGIEKTPSNNGSEGGGGESSSVLLHLSIPPSANKSWTVVPHSMWFGDLVCDLSTPCLCVGASFRVALVAGSGKLLQLWCSSASDPFQKNVTCTFSPWLKNMSPLWPHLVVNVTSEVRHVSRVAPPLLSRPSTFLHRQGWWQHRQNAWQENTAECWNAPAPPPIAEGTGRVVTMLPNNVMNQRELVVYLVGCPRLVFMDEKHCVVQWNGSCDSYNVCWRVGPTGEIHHDVVLQPPERHPEFTVDITALSALVVLFCVYGVNCVSNCITFTLLVPPRFDRISVRQSDVDGVLLLQPVLESPFTSELVKVKYHIEVELLDVETDESVPLCTASVADMSSGVWTRGFAELLERENSWTPPLSPTIEWLNPVMVVRCSLSSLLKQMEMV